MKSVLARIDPAGRLSIPAPHRKALGLEGGGPVVVALEGSEVRVRAVAAVMAELQAETARLLAGPDASVDAFLAERRAEAAREAAEDRMPSPFPTDANPSGGDDR